MTPVNVAMLILGWCSLLYGVTELVNSIKFHSNRRKLRQAQEIPVAEEVVEETIEAVPVEEVTEETTSTENLPKVEE